MTTCCAHVAQVPTGASYGRGGPFFSLRLTDSYYDSPLQENQRFSLTNVSWLLDTGKDVIMYPYYIIR